MTIKFETSAFIAWIGAFSVLLLSLPASAANWIYITDDTLGMHYINPNKVQYKKRYGTAEFLLLTNLYISGSKNF
jgi:hypothetical protein